MQSLDLGRDTYRVTHVGGDFGLDLAGHAAVRDRSEVCGAVGPLFSETALQSPRPSDADLERRRCERGQIDRVLLLTGGQGHRTIAATAGTGPAGGVDLAVGTRRAIARDVSLVVDYPRTVSVTESVRQCLSGVQRLCAYVPIGREDERGGIVDTGPIPNDLHDAGYAIPEQIPRGTGFLCGRSVVSTMEITSTAFDDGGEIPREHGYAEANTNPPLRISEVPDAAVSLVLIVDDPDAREPAGKVWDHWLVWNVAPDIGEIPEGWTPADAVEGQNDFGEIGWGGPKPPDSVHTYRFLCYALDTTLSLDPGAHKEDVYDAAEGHLVAKAELEGTYAP